LKSKGLWGKLQRTPSNTLKLSHKKKRNEGGDGRLPNREKAEWWLPFENSQRKQKKRRRKKEARKWWWNNNTLKWDSMPKKKKTV